MPRRFIGPDRPNAVVDSCAPRSRTTVRSLGCSSSPGPRPPGPRTGFATLSHASSKRRRIASAATLILVAYGLSRVLGAVRELVIANPFGTSHEIDNYRVAFGVPDLLFNLLLAGAISSAFIPVLSEHLAKGENQRAREIAQRVLNAAVLILTLGAVAVFIVAPFYVPLIAFGYSSHDHEVIVGLTRILLLQPIFLGGGGVVGGSLHAGQRF